MSDDGPPVEEVSDLPHRRTFDTSGGIRGADALEQLVRYVMGTHRNNETDWLEWKRGVDLSTAAGRFAVAKQILGFANRDATAAAAHAEGCAYVVLGAAPGQLEGQPSMDPADLGAGLRPYLGTDGPQWSPVWVPVDGRDVLVILVEPPRVGDPPFTLRRAYEGFHEGSTFVRHPGASDPANTAEVRRLAARAAARDATVLDVEITCLTAPVVLDHAGADIRRWLDDEREALLAPMRRDLATEPSMRGLVSSLNRLQEMRTADQFRAEVDAYIDACAEVLRAIVATRLLNEEQSLLSLGVENRTAKNVPAMEVIAEIHGPVLSFDDECDVPELPNAPVPWGEMVPTRLAGLSGGADLARLTKVQDITRGLLAPQMPDPWRAYRTHNDTGTSTTIRYDAFDLRPEEVVELPEVPCMVRTDAGGRLTGRWQATSSGFDGVMRGEVEIVLDDSPVSVNHVLPPHAR